MGHHGGSGGTPGSAFGETGTLQEIGNGVAGRKNRMAVTCRGNLRIFLFKMSPMQSQSLTVVMKACGE